LDLFDVVMDHVVSQEHVQQHQHVQQHYHIVVHLVCVQHHQVHVLMLLLVVSLLIHDVIMVHVSQQHHHVQAMYPFQMVVQPARQSNVGMVNVLLLNQHVVY